MSIINLDSINSGPQGAHHTSRTHLHAEKGLTLFQLLVGISLFMLVLGAAAMNFPEVRAAFLRRDAREQLVFDIKRAQSETMAEGVRGILNISNDGTSYLYGFDHPPFNPSLLPDQEVFLRVLPRYISIRSTGPVVFNSRGELIDALEELTQTSIILSYKADPFLSTTVYPSGAMELLSD